MSKKDFILNILEKIWDARPLWKILLVLWKNWELDDKMIDGLVVIMWDALKNTKDLQQKHKIEKWIKALNKLKEKEKQWLLEDEKRLSEIEDIIQNI